MTARTGLCWHCGRPDAPLGDEGYIDRHRRADHRLNVDPGNELCLTNMFAWLRPGEPCRHLAPNPYCREGKAHLVPSVCPPPEKEHTA